MADPRVRVGGHYTYTAKGKDAGDDEELGSMLQSTKGALPGVRPGLASGQPQWP